MALIKNIMPIVLFFAAVGFIAATTAGAFN